MGLEVAVWVLGRLCEAGVVMSPGSDFHPGCGQFQRMNLACSRPKLLEAIERLRKAVAKLG